MRLVCPLKEKTDDATEQGSEERIIGIPKEHEAGLPAAETCRKHGVSDVTF